MNYPPNFLIIDDDPVNNAVCQLTIKTSLKDSKVKTFTIPEKGFEYIANSSQANKNGLVTIILLDINMPTMTGWEFLNRFEQLDQMIKGQYKIYILSSSVNDKDKERAYANRLVTDYIVKPLSREIIFSIVSSHAK
jgi:CheY-like chemotaxis protein